MTEKTRTQPQQKQLKVESRAQIRNENVCIASLHKSMFHCFFARAAVSLLPKTKLACLTALGRYCVYDSYL